MTPQQYDKMNGLNACGGCMLFLCIFGVFPVMLVLTHSFLLALGAGIGAAVVGTIVINKAKADV